MDKKVWAVMMVKDEADIIFHTIKHLWTQKLDGILVLDNMSSDGTPDLLIELRDLHRVHLEVLMDAQVAYYQSQKTTMLAKIAHERHGADWIIPIDADELIYSINGKPVGDILRDTKKDIIQIPWIFHYSTKLDSDHPNPYKRMTWRDKKPNPLSKVAYRYFPDLTIAQGNHRIENANGEPVWGCSTSMLQIRHFPYRSPEQFAKKIINGGAAYLAGGDKIPEKFGAAWRLYYKHYEKTGIEGLKEFYRHQFVIVNPRNHTEIYKEDPAPYKEFKSCTELLSQINTKMS